MNTNTNQINQPLNMNFELNNPNETNDQSYQFCKTCIYHIPKDIYKDSDFCWILDMMVPIHFQTQHCSFYLPTSDLNCEFTKPNLNT